MMHSIDEKMPTTKHQQRHKLLAKENRTKGKEHRTKDTMMRNIAMPSKHQHHKLLLVKEDATVDTEEETASLSASSDDNASFAGLLNSSSSCSSSSSSSSYCDDDDEQSTISALSASLSVVGVQRKSRTMPRRGSFYSSSSDSSSCSATPPTSSWVTSMSQAITVPLRNLMSRRESDYDDDDESSSSVDEEEPFPSAQFAAVVVAERPSRTLPRCNSFYSTTSSALIPTTSSPYWIINMMQTPIAKFYDDIRAHLPMASRVIDSDCDDEESYNDFDEDSSISSRSTMSQSIASRSTKVRRNTRTTNNMPRRRNRIRGNAPTDSTTAWSLVPMLKFEGKNLKTLVMCIVGSSIVMKMMSSPPVFTPVPTSNTVARDLTAEIGVTTTITTTPGLLRGVLDDRYIAGSTDDTFMAEQSSEEELDIGSWPVGYEGSAPVFSRQQQHQAPQQQQGAISQQAFSVPQEQQPMVHQEQQAGGINQATASLPSYGLHQQQQQQAQPVHQPPQLAQQPQPQGPVQQEEVQMMQQRQQRYQLQHQQAGGGVNNQATPPLPSYGLQQQQQAQPLQPQQQVQMMQQQQQHPQASISQAAYLNFQQQNNDDGYSLEELIAMDNI